MTVLKVLTDQQCQSLLRRGRLGRLALRDGEGTYVVPVSYAYADGCIYGHSAPGRKAELLKAWPKVSLLVDEITNLSRWRSVMVRGTWHELQDEPSKDRARFLLLGAFGGQLWSVTAGHGHRTSLGNAILYRIEIAEMSGRSQNIR